MHFPLVLAGVVAGFIDAIAGGGGLITLPATALYVGQGAFAVGTNKIAGTVAAVVALLIYWKKGHFSWQRSLPAAILVWIGSLCGSFVSPLIPVEMFRWLLMATCPSILWLIWRRDLWIQRELQDPTAVHTWRGFLTPKVVCACLAAGFYDGAWGPGGGTLMLLALFFVGHLPLLEAVAGSKLMNTGSAFVSLLSYGARGYVSWDVGCWIASGIGLGAFVGAHYASKNAARLVRPVLFVVVCLLVAKLCGMF